SPILPPPTTTAFLPLAPAPMIPGPPSVSNTPEAPAKPTSPEFLSDAEDTEEASPSTKPLKRAHSSKKLLHHRAVAGPAKKSALRRKAKPAPVVEKPLGIAAILGGPGTTPPNPPPQA